MPAQPPCWVGFSILSTILTLPSSFLVTTAASKVPTTCSRCISFNASRSALASSTLSYSPAYRNIGLSLIERSFPLLHRSISPHLAILRSCLSAILVSLLCPIALLHVGCSLDYYCTERKSCSLLR